MEGVQLWEVRSHRRWPVITSAQSLEVPSHEKCPVM